MGRCWRPSRLISVPCCSLQHSQFHYSLRYKSQYWEPFKKSIFFFFFNEVDGTRETIGEMGGDHLQPLLWSFLPIFQQFPAGEPTFFQDCFNVKLILNQERSKPQPCLFKGRNF